MSIKEEHISGII